MQSSVANILSGAVVRHSDDVKLGDLKEYPSRFEHFGAVEELLSRCTRRRSFVDVSTSLLL